MSATKYLIQKLAEAEVESEQAGEAARAAAERSNSAFDRVLDAERALSVHLKERKQKAREEASAKRPTKAGVPV